jgi:serine/threonine protein phosphatase PrpC
MFKSGKIGNLDYKMVGFSVPGKTHIKNGTGNQDSFGFFKSTNGVAIAVADGVGSCLNSKMGAKLAIETIEKLQHKIEIGQIAAYESEKIKAFIIREWKSRIDGSLSDYSSTLQFVTMFPDQILRGGIGDGGVFVTIDKNEYVFKGNGEMFSNWTYALTQDIDESKFEVSRIMVSSDAQKVDMCLATDGVTSELLDGKEINFLQYIASRVHDNAKHFEKEIFDWISSLQEKNGDDKTLLLFTAERRSL